ncbi:MAG: LamG-like jellyroll fold domain-containing protein [Pirellulales bacterium]
MIRGLAILGVAILGVAILGVAILGVAILGVAACTALAAGGEFHAYYTHAAPSGGGYVGKYSDLIVVLGKGRQLEFARATGYLPVWRTPKGAKSVTDLLPGKDQDPHSYYNYVRLTESSPDRIVVHRRYFKDTATLLKANQELDVLNPHGITGVVHELYAIHPDGRVDREIREASGTRFQDWTDPRLASRQSFKLTDAGIEYEPIEPGQKPPFCPRSPVTGSVVKTRTNLPRAVHRWNFDEGLRPHEDKVVDAATSADCTIAGLMTLFTKGVSGTALAFDGYYTGVAMQAEGRSRQALTVEAWVALDAYPYNIAPFVHQSRGFGEEGWYLGLDAYGHPLVTVAGQTVRAENVVLPLYTWTHVAATVGNGKIRLYVDGREVASGDLAGPVATPPTPILIGRNNEMKRCTDPVRGPRNNLEFAYGIQGLLDEIGIYDEAMPPDLVRRAYTMLRPSDRTSALAKGVLPGEVGPVDSFGATYKTLPFSEVWDRLWRDLPGTEIVVKFDKIPCSVVYWRGTNYAANWVTDNNRWMADQSSEIGGPHGCSEHMADKQVRHCYSRVIENTLARVVIHWRYACVDVAYVSGGPGNWTDEYHTIYPDGTGVREVVWNGGGRGPSFQDIQFLTNPGESALDVMNLQAMTVANLKGESRELTWAPPNQVPKNTVPEGCIEVLNSKSEYKVFAIFQGGHINPWGHREQSKYTPDPFAGPWNHWPMHLVPSDGRFAVANDRVTHFALGANDTLPGNVVLYGFTKAPVAALVPLAQMWRNPPPLTDLHGGSAGGFDKGQKAFLLEATGTQISFTVAASDESPLVNPCFVIRNWGREGKAAVKIDGKLATGVRQGTTVDTDGTRAMVVWIEHRCASPTRFNIEADIDRRPVLKHATAAEEAAIPLAGTWRFRLDFENVGVAEKWFTLELNDTVHLPGTTDENHKGVKKDEQCVDRLSRVWYWKGPAWYQRRVTIPDAWKGKRVTLLLERSKDTRVWVDHTFCGGEDTLSAPQCLDVSRAMTPGEHTLTVLVDNARLPPVGPSHAVDERTQTNWNGIVGRIELRATAPVWLDDVQVYPDVRQKRVVVRAMIGNITGNPAAGVIAAECESYNVAKPSTFRKTSLAVKAPERKNAVEFTYEPGSDVPLWDEFQPAMLRLKLTLESTAGGEGHHDRRSVSFGMRDFKRERDRLTINGRPIFLRGKLDCCLFPLTGYPPMDKAGWLRVLFIARSYGINHYRFHSWCPPEAAFEAADELGMYLQPEVPNKRSAFAAPESKEAPKHNIDNIDVESSLRACLQIRYSRVPGGVTLVVSS